MLLNNPVIKVNHQNKYEEILTQDALLFLEKLHQKFNDRRKELLKKRIQLQLELNRGKKLDFLEETKQIRDGGWTIAPLPEDLQDRRVEITGPVDRKMIINALNSGASTFMADFEDATSPTWENIMDGQINLKDATRRKIYLKTDNGKEYKLNEKVAVLIVRPRGWHLDEKHLIVNGEPMSGSLTDFGLYFYHNAKELLNRGSGPYFYLPKLENYLEARLWNDVFNFSEDELGIPRGKIKATVLIETITAAFQMDEILYELREHSAGLNCGRWDYIFSFIKKFQNNSDVIFPDRSVVTMDVHFMRSYSLLAIQTSHKRNAPAIGGMAAQIPIKSNTEANEKAFGKIRADKEREVRDGHDGTWVAHPGMVQFVKDIFNRGMPTPNQIHRKLEDLKVTREDLLKLPDGTITEDGLRTNINVALQYITAWLMGRGAVPLNHLMEDAATAEISRAQVWQWLRHPKGVLEDGRNVSLELVNQFLAEELEKIQITAGEARYQKDAFKKAEELFENLIANDHFAEFLTLSAYEELLKGDMYYGK